MSKKLVNGQLVDMSAQEITDRDAEIAAAAADAAANGYKTARAKAYERLEEQLDKLWHDIDNGTLDQTGAFYLHRKAVKDANPKP